MVTRPILNRSSAPIAWPEPLAPFAKQIIRRVKPNKNFGPLSSALRDDGTVFPFRSAG